MFALGGGDMSSSHDMSNHGGLGQWVTLKMGIRGPEKKMGIVFPYTSMFFTWISHTGAGGATGVGDSGSGSPSKWA